MVKKLMWIVAACAAVAMSASAFAALTPGQKMAAEALIKQFGAAEFDVRQKAVDRLVELGADVIPLVKKALAETPDNEVKLRCEMVLKALGAAEPTAKPNDKFGYGPSKVTLDVKDMPLSEAIEKLAEQSGNMRINIAENLKDKTVTLSLKDAEYWVAVDKVCEPLNLLVVGDWRRMSARGEEYGWFQMLEAEKDLRITGYSGPVVVKPGSCVKTMQYRAAKAGGGMGMWGQGLNFSFTYCYEDRIEPLMSAVEVKVALAPDGRNLLPPEGARVAASGMGMGWGNQKVPPFATVSFSIPKAPDDLAKLAEISGIVRLEFGSGEKEVVINDVLNAVGKEMTFDDWTIKILKIDKNRGGLQVQIEAQYKGQPVELPAWMTAGSGYGWWVKDQDGGKKTRGWSMGSGMRLAMPGAQGGGAVAAPEAPKKGESTVYFQGNYEAGTYSLTLLLPKVHETKEYPFILKDIPLP